MRVARLGFARASLAVGVVLGLTAFGGATAAAWPGQQGMVKRSKLKHAFEVTVAPAYATAGLPTTFQVTIANTSAQTTMLRSVQVTPPAGFTVAHPSPTAPLRSKTFVHKRTLSLHQISLKPGHKLEFNVTATAPTTCGSGTPVRWTSRAFQGSSPAGPQLTFQRAGSTVGVTVVCPQVSTCAASGPACSTTVKTSVSSYGVTSNAAAGTLEGTLNVGRELKCGAYRFRDPNWYGTAVTPPASGLPPGAPPIVDQVSYTILNASSQGLGFCLGALYDFPTASGAMAPARKLPNGKRGFIGLLPMCTPASPPCISSISQQPDSNAKSGSDAVMIIQIPEQGDPWGAG
ncbi:MAG TPA: hypothetical protein VMJ65_19300 [Solirubrobacteraceae bacterium]|nr:hypothetical protein [Solirubrobacteraceae bacterium]